MLGRPLHRHPMHSHRYHRSASSTPSVPQHRAYYVRKTQPRHARPKNGDAQIIRLCRRTSHYKVIQYVCQGASLIRIHLRRALGRAYIPLQSNSRCALKTPVADLIAGWGHCGTNRRHANSRASPITK
jgi:hypothetical protein